MLPEPYLYIRAITLGLGMIWTLRGLLRLWHFMRDWEDRLEWIGLERSWLRRQLISMTLKTTILDPINLALLLLLFGTWTLRAWLEQ